ncbi:ribosomal-processing cysteine protease Prp [Marispirochaeta sp.]|uniref:ribosomal-processing cysteine protease Prp n=1 Tax=Marispirochaeta sp. TaxID=2038653 RepID=UPI0029C7FEBD|nr:ribosomal-processing cysteine protease Prp [Marispirochaeta sp.]
MIRVRLTVVSGLLRNLDAEGHARDAGENDAAVCAAVSLLCRSAAQALKDLDDLEIDGSAPQPGVLRFSVVYGKGASIERARGVSDTLIRGLEAVARESPRLCVLEISSGDPKKRKDHSAGNL